MGTVSPVAEKYTMRISRLTIDKLGIHMYDRVSAVIAELIANCYDADATTVIVTLPFGKYLAERGQDGEAVDLGYEITITDNGSGMLSDEVNAYYLKVGINRRTTRGQTTEKGRPVLGRKGIGKLAPFGICREIEVLTAGGVPDATGKREVSNLILRYDGMLTDDEEDYHPSPGPLDGSKRCDSGTKIILRDFERRRVPAKGALHRQISARFGISRQDWEVRVTDSADPDDTVTVGELDVPLMDGTEICVDERPVSVRTRDGADVERVAETLPVTGWVAYAKDPYKDEAMAGVRVFARGKLVAQTRDFEIGAGFTGEYKMRSYVVGEVHADWLDDTDDLVRSDRQGIIWTSEKGEALQRWGIDLLKELAGRSETSVRNRVWEEFLERSQLMTRLDRALPKDADLREAVARAAKSLVRPVDRDQVRHNERFVDRVVQLAFALGPHQTLLRTLDEIAAATSDTLEPVIALFEKAGVVEMYSLGQVAHERVEAVEMLQGLVRSGATLEDELQRLVERAPWILYPDWTPLTQNAPLSRLRTAFESWYLKTKGVAVVTTTIGSPRREPDFVMLNYEGRIEIVEIKRPDHALTDEEYSRAFNYLDAVTTFLDANPDLGELFPRVRLTIVCDDLALRNPVNASSIESEERIVRKSWESVLHGTMQAHQDFLERVRVLQGQLPAVPNMGDEENEGNGRAGRNDGRTAPQGDGP